MSKPGSVALPRPSRAYLLALGAVALVIALIPVAYLLRSASSSDQSASSLDPSTLLGVALS